MSLHEYEPTGDSLPLLLRRIASDPRRTNHLHGVLGWYCHESRNFLNCLKMSMYLAKRARGDSGAVAWADVESSYDELERSIDRLHRLCRPTPLNPVCAPLGLLFEERRAAWSQVLSACGRRLGLDAPAGAAVGSFDPTLLGLALDDLVAWRAQVGAPGSALRVSWSADPATAEFDVVWSEPAVVGRPARDAERSAAGDGVAQPVFCIPLLTRIVTLHGGTVETSEREGWQLRMRWPRDASTPREE
jgi:hypothetical protein